MNSPQRDRTTAEAVQFAAEQNPASFPAGTAPAIAHLIERDREAERRREQAVSTHPAQVAAIAGNNLRHQVRRLSDNESVPDRVGLTLAANIADQLADALDRHWQLTRRHLEV